MNVTWILSSTALALLLGGPPASKDPIAALQQQAVEAGAASFGHWGPDPSRYINWSSHSNRLIPVYTFGTKGAGEGIDLESYTGKNSPYRDEKKIEALYSYLPEATLNPEAGYCDQTNIFDIQKKALEAGKKHIFLVVFDGMDWHATRTAAVAKTGEIYEEGRGHGLFFLDYVPPSGQFSYMVTSPYCDKVRYNVDTQGVAQAKPEGGYDPKSAGSYPWSLPSDPQYIIGKGKIRHAYTDSSTSASSMSTGIKSYNGAVNIAPDGSQVDTIAHLAQRQGYSVGVATSVPVPHATPGAMYAHNVTRNDYQDISRDLLGLPSVSHPTEPLPGMDVVIGTGYGVKKDSDANQGANYKPGSRYLADEDLEKADLRNGGKYLVATRTAGHNGSEVLKKAAEQAATEKQRLLGFFGTRYGHLPLQTANGDFEPVVGLRSDREGYTKQDIEENPTLVDMTKAAIQVLKSRSDKGIWLMVEAGDVDWSMHQNNIDDMIGAIYSGDDAVRTIAEWVEANSSWDESVMIVTADHGHYLVIDDMKQIAAAAKK